MSKQAYLKVISASVLSLAIGVTLNPQVASAQSSDDVSFKIERSYGPGRIETAAAVAINDRSSADTVLIATANDWPDAITSTALANANKAPLLLTSANDLPKATVDSIKSLGAKKAIILGGSKAISERVAQQLSDLNLSVERLSGKGRAETAAQIAKSVGLSDNRMVVISSGWGDDAWTKAIAASALGASNAMIPTLLTTKDELPETTIEALKALNPLSAVVVGDTSSISNHVLEQLHDLGIRPNRVSGLDQYQLSANIIKQYRDEFSDSSSLVFASGENFADGLAAGSFAAHVSAPMVLVQKEYLGSSTTNFLRNWPNTVTSGVIVGGEKATNRKVEEEIGVALAQRNSGNLSSSTPELPEDEYDKMLAELESSFGKAEKSGSSAVEGYTEPIIDVADPNLKDAPGAEFGVASFYTDTRVAEPGGSYDSSALEAAHKTLPFGTLVKVTNLKNSKSVVVRINDRGPYIAGRIIDLTPAAAEAIDMVDYGIVDVKLEIVGIQQ